MSTIEEAISLQRLGKAVRAELIYRQILAVSPKNAPAKHLLGLLCQESGRRQEALQLILGSIEADSNVPDFHSNLAAVYGSMGRLEESLQALQRAIELRPDHAPSYHNQGVTLERLRRFPEAESAYRRSVELAPNEARFHHHLGNALRKQHRLREASLAYQQALTHDPKLKDTWVCLGAIAGEQGLCDQSIACCRRAVEVAPDDPGAHSNLLFALHYDSGLSAETLFREHRTWADKHETPRIPQGRIHHHDPTPDRRLRIGYISADFREHTRIRFMEPVLAHHDHRAFEVYCYSDVPTADDTTERIKRYADVWRDTLSLSDGKFAGLICQDRIDVLVELTGHMGNNRLTVFAYKPSPVQVAYPGYPNTTGMNSIEYLLTDTLRDPAGSERQYTEKLVFIEPTSQCYSPGEAEHAGPQIVAPPCQSAGFITFGSLNKPIKANQEVLNAWAKILIATPNSRLLIPAKDQDAEGLPCSILVGALAKRGIDRSRVHVVTGRPRGQYLSLYNSIDIALDPWPYNGHTTTLDALWMGVPVVALQGDAHVSRETSCVLTLLGLQNLIADNVDEYVAIATRTAADPTGLATLRRTLRDRMLSSPLSDSQGLTRKIEAAYRRMWRSWCGAHPSQPQNQSLR